MVLQEVGAENSLRACRNTGLVRAQALCQGNASVMPPEGEQGSHIQLPKLSSPSKKERENVAV